MKVGPAARHDLTYCLNVHRGEQWDENLEAIRTHVLPLRTRVSPGTRFGLGLRLSHAAAQTLGEPEALAACRAFLSEHNLYVFTINAFPYGTFHGQPVKTAVYRPDWCTRERVAYTTRVADIAAGLAEPGATISISTVPGSYRSWITETGQVRAMVEGLMDVVAHLARLEQAHGCRVTLGLEPEPDCYLETTADVVSFFEGPLRTHGLPYLATAWGQPETGAQALVSRHLGICFDTCHLALQFEDLADSVRTLTDAGILISKVQLSAALSAPHTTATRAALQAFVDPVYLHQVKVRRAGQATVSAHADLDAALADTQADPQETWRVHVHVPLYFDTHGPLGSTAPVLTPAFFAALRERGIAHLEIETYTFDVLPPALRAMGVVESVAHEYAWVRERL